MNTTTSMLTGHGTTSAPFDRNGAGPSSRSHASGNARGARQGRGPRNANGSDSLEASQYLHSAAGSSPGLSRNVSGEHAATGHTNGRPRSPYEIREHAAVLTNGVHGYDLGEPSEQEEEEDDDETVEDRELGDQDSDDLSTTSGRRHGALLMPDAEDFAIFKTAYITHWSHKRHRTTGNPRPKDPRDLPDWRMKERLRTVTASLVMCLNIGVDPPDVSKTDPCSKLICWMDPTSLEVSKALPAIGKNLQAQFETLSMKTRYKQYLDPIVEEMKRSCTSQRRSAKDERVLFYYNGYGVPKPTPGGEIWVFNKAYTQYIPVTLYDLQTWLGNPCIYVWDASAAGNIVVNFRKLDERRQAGQDETGREQRTQGGTSEDAHFPLRESIHLAACGPDEILPMNPDLPADLFTCCLTSPIEISLRWFVLQNPLPSKLTADMVMNIPGRLQDRRTPLGELNWIFTAITDTIAWTVLPRAIFRRLFRDDLMVAALLRNFLLAERIMRFYHCKPMSHPTLPETHNHPLWDSWDLAVDQCLAQLPQLLEKEKAVADAANGGPPVPPHLAAVEYKHSSFFSEQLQAFEVWLSQGGVSRTGRRRRVDALSTATQPVEELDEDEEAQSVRSPPEQLPIVLQVLLSQVHRVRALILLSNFLDLGPWAVNLALSIGIFPYVLKLLQSPAVDLKPVLIYIWARILAVDRSCQNDLLRDKGFAYFASVLSPFGQGYAGQGGGLGAGGPQSLPIPNVSEHRAMCAFILSVFCYDFPAGQQVCLEQTDVLEACLEHLEDDDYLLRQWSAVCLARLWENSELGKARGLERDSHGKLCCMLGDASAEVRAAVLHSLGALLGCETDSNELPTSNGSSGSRAAPRRRVLGTGSSTGLPESSQRGVEIGIAIAMISAKADVSPMVRKELVIALSPVVREYRGFFVLAAYLYFSREEHQLHQGGRRSSYVESPEDMRDAQSTEAKRAEWQQDSDALLARVLQKLVIEWELDERDIANVSAFSTLFVALLDLSSDSHPEVSALASTVVDYIIAHMLESDVARASQSIIQRMNPESAAHRRTTPTAVVPVDDYFGSAPLRSLSQTAIEADLRETLAAAPSAVRTPSFPPNRKSSSLAQAVKSIATLAYSRPSSPQGIEDNRFQSSPSLSNAVRPSGDSAAIVQPVTPSISAVQYTSPYSRATSYTDSHDGLSDRGSPSPHNAVSRSVSVESLAHIANRQDRRRTTPTTTPRTDDTSSTSSPHPSEAGWRTSDVHLADAFVGLIAEDLQRFRSRHLPDPEQPSKGSSAGNTPLPSPGMQRSGRTGGPPLSIQTHAEPTLRTTVPLKSRYFAWCSECYTEPQMKSAEANEPGSIRYNIQTWKRQRNERVVEQGQDQASRAAVQPWNNHVNTLHLNSTPYAASFHQFENHLVIASESDVIDVWDWKKGQRTGRFHNGNPARSNITSLLFVNEDVESLLLVGSSEGQARLYRGYDRPLPTGSAQPKILTSFAALPELLRSRRPSGLILDWQQVTGHLLAGGDSRLIRVWDAHRELCVCDIPTRTSSCVTSISTEVDMGHIFVTGFGDGTVGVYDRRNPPEASLVRLWEEHTSWITKVQLQKRGNRELISCSVDGEVRLWDIRGRSSIGRGDLTPGLRGRISCFAAHERTPVFAAASVPRMTRAGLSPQRFSLFSMETMQPLGGGKPIVRTFTSTAAGSTPATHAAPLYGGSSIDLKPTAFAPAAGCVAFHPHLNVVAYGGPESHMDIKSFSSNKRAPNSENSGSAQDQPIPTLPSSESKTSTSSGWLSGW